ncbi:MAG TPA: hypothetical protein VFA33_29565 [Bryobacteraceae bacterium]|nr:hypothetical protein [Bryobacteraceae bacterium]
MELAQVFLKLGDEGFGQLIRGISIGKLKTYQIYDGLKARAHVGKLNTEILRKSALKFRVRLEAHDEDLAKDLAQAVLVSHLDMITAVLDFLGIPHEGGFFAKDADVKQYLAGNWAERVWEQFGKAYPAPLLLFYINHLAWELTDAAEPFVPQAPTG